jgi:hypothetical protein
MRCRALEPDSRDKIGGALSSDRQIGENLLVEKPDLARIEIGGHFGQKEFDKLYEEFFQQLFEELIVIGHALYASALSKRRR